MRLVSKMTVRQHSYAQFHFERAKSHIQATANLCLTVEPTPALNASSTAGLSTMGISTVFRCTASTRALRIELLSPEAPELVASAASTSTIRPLGAPFHYLLIECQSVLPLRLERESGDELLARTAIRSPSQIATCKLLSRNLIGRSGSGSSNKEAALVNVVDPEERCADSKTRQRPERFKYAMADRIRGPVCVHDFDPARTSAEVAGMIPEGSLEQCRYVIHKAMNSRLSACNT